MDEERIKGEKRQQKELGQKKMATTERKGVTIERDVHNFLFICGCSAMHATTEQHAHAVCTVLPH